MYTCIIIGFIPATRTSATKGGGGQSANSDKTAQRYSQQQRYIQYRVYIHVYTCSVHVIRICFPIIHVHVHYLHNVQWLCLYVYMSWNVV